MQSHHCIQEGRLPLDVLLNRGVPVLVDAAAEQDLRAWIAAGADLVTYSGGKAIGGPTCGFIAGKRALIDACEMQQRGIARAMKVGKEQIMGLLTALDGLRPDSGDDLLEALHAGLARCADAVIAPDRAGRPIRRVALDLPTRQARALVRYLHDGEPSIRTRNHELDAGRVLFDPRELRPGTRIGDRRPCRTVLPCPGPLTPRAAAVVGHQHGGLAFAAVSSRGSVRCRRACWQVCGSWRWPIR